MSNQRFEIYGEAVEAVPDKSFSDDVTQPSNDVDVARRLRELNTRQLKTQQTDS